MRARIWAIVALLLVGAVTQRLGSREQRSADSWASLGGLRELAAGLQWVRAYGAWRERDEAELERRLNWTVRLDPETLPYWLNGARMICHDMAAWRIEAATTLTQAREIRAHQLARALRWLELAENALPNQSAIAIEQAALHWTVHRDTNAVIAALARAQTCSDVPYFVARLRAEMLRRSGRPHEALTVLEAVRPGLPETDPAAMVPVVDQRIAELRHELGR